MSVYVFAYICIFNRLDYSFVLFFCIQNETYTYPDVSFVGYELWAVQKNGDLRTSPMIFKQQNECRQVSC